MADETTRRPTRRDREAAVRDAGAPDDAAVREGLPSPAEQRQAAEQSGQREPRFPVSRLLTEGTILGEPVAIVAAALHSAGLPEDAELTRAEAQRLVEAERDRIVNPTEEG